MNDKNPSPSVAVRLSLEFIGGRPPGMDADEHVTSIICAVIGGVVEQTVKFLDEHPEVTEVKSQRDLREHIMNGVLVAATEQLCAAWKFAKHEDDLPTFVKMMYSLFEETIGAEENMSARSTVRDVGHA